MRSNVFFYVFYFYFCWYAFINNKFFFAFFNFIMSLLIRTKKLKIENIVVDKFEKFVDKKIKY